jgi:PAS domain S-box-containing protein
LDHPYPSRSAESTLRESERQYRELVEGARNVVFRVSETGDLGFLNRTFETITGWPAHQWLGRPLLDIVHPDDRARGSEALRRALAGTAPLPFDLRIPTATGRLCVLEVTLVADQRDDRVVGIIGTAVDVTERRLLEAEAARQERQLAVAQQLARLGSFEWDVRTGTLVWSDELRRIYAVPEALHNLTFRDFLDRAHPEDRERVEATILEAVADRATFALEQRVVRPDGGVRQLELRGEVIRDEGGRAVAVIGSCQDVTERRDQEAALRRAEAEYRQLVQSVQAIVWRADALTMQFRFVSHEAEPLLRYPLARWLEEPAFWREHVHPEDREWVSALRRRAVAERRDHEAEYRMIAADGRVLWVRDVARVRGGERRAPELFGVTIDVTERRRAEEELRRSREQLSDLSAHLEWVREEERARIAGEIHDELGQALTALRMDVSWLRTHAGAPPERVLAKLRDMEELIDDTIGRARRICSELRPGVLDDLGLEAAVEWQAQEFERRTGVRCQVVSSLPAPGPDREVSTTLFRILQESLTNVARHAAAANVRVELRQEGARVLLEVRDDGRGAAAALPAGRRSLGVVGMNERARRLGGTFTFNSTPGRGSCVQASIPLARPTEAADADPPPPAESARVPAGDPAAS